MRERFEMDIVKILNDAGYETVEGAEETLQAIKGVADTNTMPLCSGYRVFPDGERCLGCSDCNSR